MSGCESALRRYLSNHIYLFISTCLLVLLFIQPISLTNAQDDTISGVVMDAMTGNALSDIRVMVSNVNQEHVAESVTDTSGFYAIDGLIPDEIYYVNATGYNVVLGQTTHDAQLYENVSIIASATLVFAGASDVNFALQPQNLISGVVTDAETGQPIVGTRVIASNISHELVATTLTDDNGRYTFDDLPVDETFYISSTGIDHLTEHPTHQADNNYIAQMYIRSSTQDAANDINFALQRLFSLSGRVTDAETGDPLPNIQVVATTSPSKPPRVRDFYDLTDENGNYEITGLYPNQVYQLGVTGYNEATGETPYLWGYYPYSPGNGNMSYFTAEETDLNFELILSKMITGTVRESTSGEPLPDMQVYCSTIDDLIVYSDENGYFECVGFDPDTEWVIKASGRDSAGNFVTPFQAETIALPGSEVVDLAVVMPLTISGTITDAATGLPLENASVSARNGENQHPLSATTDENGNYILEGAHPEQMYIVRAGRRISDVITHSSGEFGSPVEAGATGINLALESTLSISGTVVDAETGQPLSGVEIVPHSSRSFSLTDHVQTDENGYYVVPGIPRDDTIRLFASLGEQYLPEYYDDADYNSPTWVEAGSTNINFALQKSPTISGTVTDAATGASLSDFTVTIYDSSHDRVKSVTTDVNGEYIFYVTPERGYFVGVSPGSESRSYTGIYYSGTTDIASATFVMAGSTGINFEMGGKPGLTGTVTDADTGLPIEGAAVTLHRSPYGQNANYSDQSGQIYTDAAGVYRFDNLNPDADYYVEVTGRLRSVSWEAPLSYMGQFYPNVSSAEEAWLLQPGVTQVDFALKKREYITGTVVRDTDRTPLNDIEVLLYDHTRSLVTSTTPNFDGVYLFEGLVPGTEYFIEVREPQRPSFYESEHYAGEFYGGTVDLEGAARVRSGATDVNFVLNVAESISGAVVDAEGVPLPYMEVRAYTPNRHLAAVGYTNEEGSYRLETLRQGASYYVEVTGKNQRSQEFYTYVNSFYSGTNSFDSASLVESGTTGVNLRLDRNVEISGTVTDGITGQLIPFTIVELHYADHEGSPTLVSEVRTDEAGKYAFVNYLRAYEDLEKHFVLRAAGTVNYYQAYLPEFYNDEADFAAAIPVLHGTINANFVLETSLTISGTVTDAITGVPLPNVEITASGGVTRITPVTTDVSGNYRLEGVLPDERYRLQAKPQNSGASYVGEYYGDTPDIFAAEFVNGGATDVDFALKQIAPISGTVTDAQTGAPLADMTVVVYQIGWPSIPSGYATTISIPSEYVTTDANGQYITPPLIPWFEYRIKVIGMHNSERIFTHAGKFYPDTAEYNEAANIQAGATGIDFSLQPPAVIRGVATDAGSGEPVSSLRITLQTATGYNATSTTTSSDGTFVFEGLHPQQAYYIYTSGTTDTGNNTIHASQVYSHYPQYFPAGDQLTSATAVVPNSEPVEFTLQRSTHIEGTITDAETGQPLAGMQVIVSGRFVYSDTNGHYVLQGINPDADYIVYVSGRNEARDFTHAVQYYPGTNTSDLARRVEPGSTGIDFVLQRDSRITGFVTNEISGAPLVNTSVSALNEDGSMVSTTVSGHDGNYSIYGLEHGKSYYIVVIPEQSNPERMPFRQYYPDASDLENSVLVAAGSENINVAFRQSVSISGVITEAATGLGTISAIIRAYDLNGNEVSSTEGAGAYTIDGLEPGKYYYIEAMLSHFGQGVSDIHVFYPDHVRMEDATPVLAGSQNINLEIARGASISGSVRDGVSGNLLREVDIFVYDMSGKLLRHVQTDHQGYYRVDGLRPGESYYVRCDGLTTLNYTHNVANIDYNLALEFFEDALTMEESTPVTAGSDGIDFVLEKSISISGYVRYTDNVSISMGTQVIIYDEELHYIDESVTRTASADHNGAYTFQNLRPGHDYYVYASGYQPMTDGSAGGEVLGFRLVHDSKYYPSAVEFSDAVPISTPTSDADIVIEYSGTLSGSVEEAGTGYGLAGMEVIIYNSRQEIVRETTTLTGGVFQVDVLPLNDVYYVQVTGQRRQEQTHTGQFYNGSTGIETATPVEPNTSEISLILEKLPE